MGDCPLESLNIHGLVDRMRGSFEFPAMLGGTTNLPIACTGCIRLLSSWPICKFLPNIPLILHGVGYSTLVC